MKTMFQYVAHRAPHLFLWSICLIYSSCMGKFLDERYNHSHAIPQTLDDYQAILDNGRITNDGLVLDLGTLSADEFYVQNEVYNGTRSEADRNMYIWAKDIFGMADVRAWDYSYKRILHCNIVIDGVESKSFDHAEKNKKESILGTAYFIRALSYFELGQVFCKQYDVLTAKKDLGIPIRLSYDVNIVVKRSSVEDLYQQILKDLKLAVDLLPENTLIRERPNKTAALALLARVYLQQRNYEQAYDYAKLALEESSRLLDFKTIANPGVVRPDGSYYTFEGMTQTHPEILFMFRAYGGSFINNYMDGDLNIDTLLLASYEPGDLRKKVYFYKDGDYDVFIGVYTGEAVIFVGLATDELYLILAEAACRIGKQDEALTHLNMLLSHRFDDSFVPLKTQDKQALLSRIIEERRKELVFRGTRWPDLRRLNQEAAFSKVLYRKLNDKTYELQPNSSRYVFPIPYSSILQSGLEDNIRN